MKSHNKNISGVFIKTLVAALLVLPAGFLYLDSALAADPGGDYTCQWKVEKSDSGGDESISTWWIGQCVIANDSCIAGYKTGDKCHGERYGYAIDTKTGKVSNEEKLKEKRDACLNVNKNPPSCVVANPEFKCQWVAPSGDPLDPATYTPPHCERKTSCDSGFTYSVDCSKLSKENCESDKDIKKNCVALSKSSGGGTPPEKTAPGTEKGKSVTITLFQDFNYTGRSQTFDSDSPAFSEFKVSSIKITGGTWEVCDKENYGSPCLTLSDNVANLKEKGLNDKISSLRRISVEKVAPVEKTAPVGEIEIKNPLNFGTIPQILDEVSKFLFTIGTALVTVMVLWGGFQILTSAGNPSQVDKGKQTLLWAVLGTVVILIAGGIAELIKNILGGGPA